MNAAPSPPVPRVRDSARPALRAAPHAFRASPPASPAAEGPSRGSRAHLPEPMAAARQRPLPGRQRQARRMAPAGATRALERLFVGYFLSHIPITVLLDSQALSSRFHPRALTDLLKWYTASFKDPLMEQPPAWFKSFVYCEIFFQLPFFPVAVYAFWKGNCKWIRTPAIIYATHVATSLVPLLTHFLLHDFSNSKSKGPETWHERLWLCSVYGPYLLIPLLLLWTMLFNPSYNSVEKRKTT